jgi:hypothetical protein
VAEEQDNRRESDWETLKLYFEFFKHFTTLSTAIGLIELALFRELDLSVKAAIFGIGSMGATVLLSLIGMLLMVVRPVHEEHGLFGVRPGYWTFVLATFVVSLFFTSILVFTSVARGISISGPIF